MRLDKYVSHNSGISRSDARKAIRAGRVQLDGAPYTDPALLITPGCPVALDGNDLTPRTTQYIMLHKPAGYVSATQDSQPTVIDLLPVPLQQLHIAGRLDKDTTGLLLLTDDGQWSHRITSPHRDCKKCYRVTTAEPVTDALLDKLRNGIMLRNESRPTLPADAERETTHTLRLYLREGKYHQVKRMIAAAGNHVTQLHRISIGTVELDPNLNPGHWRSLTPDEVACF